MKLEKLEVTTLPPHEDIVQLRLDFSNDLHLSHTILLNSSVMELAWEFERIARIIREAEQKHDR